MGNVGQFSTHVVPRRPVICPHEARALPCGCPVGALWVPGSNWADDATCSYLSAMKIIANLTLLHVVCFGTQYRMA